MELFMGIGGMVIFWGGKVHVKWPFSKQFAETTADEIINALMKQLLKGGEELAPRIKDRLLNFYIYSMYTVYFHGLKI